MRRSATDREKRVSLGTFANDPQTASSPELPSGFMSSLLDFDGRPRSWSSNTSQRSRAGGAHAMPQSTAYGQAGNTPPNFTRSLRSASIRSGARGAQNMDVALDGAATQSRPRVATSFASDARRIEARGQILSHESRPSSASSMLSPKRRQALSMMKPLATSSQDTDCESSAVSTTVTPRNSTRTCSKGSSGSSIDEEQHIQQPAAISSSLPHDLAALQMPPTSRRMQKSARAEPAVAVATVQNDSAAQNDSTPSRPASSQSSSLWAAISRLSLGNDSQGSLDSGAATRKAAVDRLKEIERKQPAEHLKEIERTQPSAHVGNSLAANSDNAAVATEEQAAAVTVTDVRIKEPHAEEPYIEEPDVKEQPRGSTWLGWWPGAGSQPSKPTQASSGIVATGISVVASSEAQAADAAAPITAECPPHPPGSASAKNMLMPDFDVGSGELPVDVLAGSRLLAELRRLPSSSNVQTDEARTADKHARTETKADAGAPLHKRLRTMGQAVVDSAMDMAPGWARTMLQGQRVADAQGQRRDPGSGDGPAPTADQLKELMDGSARQLGKIAVIGVHGWFPRRMLQMLAGEPTGKSEKFCIMMRDALKAYLLESHGVAVDDSDISLFPLIGEGRIQDRVELLLAQLIDVAESDQPSEAAADTDRQAELAAEALMPPRRRRAAVLREADTVFVVTHSQGTPVSAMLVERLLEAGILDAGRQRVGLLAMAGIGHGPLAHLRDNVVIKYIESGAARELFELMDPSSFQSQRFVAALSTILHAGVRVVCVGSWVDEVVPLHSATVQGVSHPHVFRAVYVDAAHYADDFLTGLIVFALRLRNAGMYDHGLLVHLSGVVAGSLWGHWGHSTIYAEPAVYKLAVKWLLLSTAAAPEPAHMSYRPFHAGEPLNPFYIPSIMRTLWDDPAIQACSSLRAELQRLVALFDAWAPETRAAKELRYRLEPVSCFQ